MKILLVTDAWAPQVNGVVRTLVSTIDELRRLGHQIDVISPEGRPSIPCPTYPEIPLSLFSGRYVAERIRASGADVVHIATEGPLGLAARRHCLQQGIGFTTAYHTAFPEYVAARTGFGTDAIYRFMRWFHAPAAGVMVATDSLQRQLAARGFTKMRPWSRGVDANLFKPSDKSFLAGPRPIHLYAGRVVVDKNIEAFLKLDLPGSKYVVGGGPQLAKLRRKYPDARYTGYASDAELAACYAAADVFVFPSRTDTFGLVLLEALAAGIPVAAYPVTGPLEVIGDFGVGCLDEDLGRAITGALKMDPAACRAHALRYTWADATQQFLSHLQPQGAAGAAAAG